MFLTASPVTAKDSKQYKTTKPQIIPRSNVWTDLDFDGLQALPAGKPGRALYSVQVAFKCSKGKKPRYAKIRLARVLPDGSLDTTATNTYSWGRSGPKTLWASLMWQIKAKYPVKAQVKIVGGTCRTITTRQLKMWQPPSLPDTK